MFVSNRYIVSIGSNFHPEQNVAKAQQLITTYFDEVHFVHCRWTLPVGDIYQSNFYNTAAAFSTPLSAEALKRQLKLFEAQIGRPGAETGGYRAYRPGHYCLQWTHRSCRLRTVSVCQRSRRRVVIHEKRINMPANDTT